MMTENIPNHLKKYIVDQNYDRYTPIDQATWRYVLRQLKDFLSKNAHECYLEGLEKTGISSEEIPKISEMNKKLKNFGWQAVPVSGFIPPAAFMELQSLSLLPIASDMRSLDHLLYTPAPDIVHEAAGHAPILVNAEYAEYLKAYAQVAKKSIISKDDLEIYEAIRNLSDVKENSSSTEKEIENCEQQLQLALKKVTYISEATLLSRMNWWTAEYGLIGPMSNPKLFGAGLLSSVGEAKWCLSNQVKKIPLTVDCIKQSYDITEPQPQLYVTPDFKTLTTVLHEMSEKMSYKIGGAYGLDQAIKAESVNTFELDTGLQISGVITNYEKDQSGEPIYVQTTGPTQISYRDRQIESHSKDYHLHGYGCPVGPFQLTGTFENNQTVQMKYESGVVVSGQFKKILKIAESVQIVTLTNASAKLNNKVLFDPAWGDYDIAVGKKVVSVFGGPADRKEYGDTDDFVAARVQQPTYSDQQKNLFSLYQTVRNFRKSESSADVLQKIFSQCLETASDQWLLFVELLEICHYKKINTSVKTDIQNQLENLKKTQQQISPLIEDGLRLSPYA